MRLVRAEKGQVEPFGSFGLFPRLFERWPEWMTLQDDSIEIDEFRENGTLVVRADLPGIDPDKDVEITVTDGMLQIRAERRKEEKTEGRDYYRSELRYGAFTRMLPLPAGATEKDIKAIYNDGVLEVRVPIGEPESKSTKVPVGRT